MKRPLLLSLFVLVVLTSSKAQDSTVVMAHPSYDSVTNIHKLFFGENYRKEWAVPTKVPIIKISEINGGLTATERGGGKQTHSIRLVDKQGKEWVLRSTEKYPEILIPEQFRETFAKDWVNDNMSAQHPYAALIVPVLAKATGVPHTNPIIGLVAPDKALGEFAKDFENKLCLLEERDPIGKSDNTQKMFENLDADNDNSVNSEAYLKAMLLDIVIGDWDRHPDQWRWVDKQKGAGKHYLPVPRDRDQVFYVNQGLIPRFASRGWYFPFLQGYRLRLRNINTYLWESRSTINRILNGMSYSDWMRITSEFVQQIPDPVLEKALKQLPQASYQLRHDELFQKLKSQRDHLNEEIDKFYRFFNKIVDIQTSDKNELVEIKDSVNNSLWIKIYKISKEGKVKQPLFSKNLDPAITKEVRIFVAKGNDQIKINNSTSPIKIRVVGGEGNKEYAINDAKRKVNIYEKTSASFDDPHNRVRKHLSNDSINSAIVITNRYPINEPLINVGYNRDDGFLFGLGIKHTQQGFRKTPYASVQRLTITHSFSTEAYLIKYSAEWIKAFANADFTMQATAFGPNNTMNFYGRGNETQLVKTGDYKTFYRSRFNMFEAEPALRWNIQKGTAFTAGASFQYYHLNSNDNIGRLTNNPSLIGSYDSTSINQDKLHAGIVLGFLKDRRSSAVLPSSGTYFNIRLQAYQGLNNESKSFAQILPELRYYKSLTHNSALVFADRVGGGVSVGKTTFYQSLFLGGQSNLLGYSQFRFAGQHMVYNNLELRLRLAQLASYILPGELGLSGFYDTGRVWEKDQDSQKWHHGVGGGVYFSPAQYAVFQFIQGYSTEGWYPYVRLGIRF